MKKIIFPFALLLFIFCNTELVQAQTTLAPGDIAVFWYQADTPDKFAFTTFVAVDPGTQIIFTDCGAVPNGTFDPAGCGEGAVVYTVNASGLAIGDIVIYDDSAPAGEFSDYGGDPVITGTSGIGTSTAGDQITVIQGSGVSPTFIFMISGSSTTFSGDDSNSTTETNLFTGLTDTGLPRTALAVGSGPAPSQEWDNAMYNGAYTFTTVEDAKIALTNPANYSGVNAITDAPYAGLVAGIPSFITYTTVSPIIPVTIVGLTGADKIYNGDTIGGVTGTAVLSGVAGGDVVTITGTPIYTFASPDVGTGITITTTGYTLGGADAGKYTLTQPTLIADITEAPLTVTGLTGDDKAFDGTTVASASGTPSLSGVLTGDSVILGGSPLYTFASANVGTDISITTTGFTISGINAGNYELIQPTLSADINPTLSNSDFDELYFEFHPNPTSSTITISTSVELVTIYSIAGKKVFETNSSSFSVEKLSEGIYLMLIQTEKGSATRKFIKK